MTVNLYGPDGFVRASYKDVISWSPTSAVIQSYGNYAYYFANTGDGEYFATPDHPYPPPPPPKDDVDKMLDRLEAALDNGEVMQDES